MRNEPGHPKVEELAASEWQDVVAYCDEVLALKLIPDEGMLALVDSFLRCD